MSFLGTIDGTMKVWQTDDATNSFIPTPKHNININACEAIPGSFNVLTMSGGDLWRWDGVTGDLKSKWRFEALDYNVDGLAVSSASHGRPQLVAIQASDGGDILVCPLENLNEDSLIPYTIQKHEDEDDYAAFMHLLTNIQFSADGKYLVVDGCKSEGYEVCLVEITDSVSTYKTIYIGGHTASVSGATFSMDSKHLLSWSQNENGEMIKWNIAEQKQVASIIDAESKKHDIPVKGSIISAIFIPNTHYVASCNNKGGLHIRDEGTLEVLTNIVDDPNMNVIHLKSTMDGSHIITAGYQGWIYVRRLPDLAIVAKYHIGAYVCGLAVTRSPDGCTIISCGDFSGHHVILHIKQ